MADEEEDIIETEDDVEVEEEEESLIPDDVPDYEVPDEVDDSDIPDKYKGKSVKEIIEMHQNLEHYLGVKPDKRLEKMRDNGVIDFTSVDEIDVDETSIPDVDDMVKNQALGNLQMINESSQLGLKFDSDGFVVEGSFNENNIEHKKAWDIAVKMAQNTVNMFNAQLKPIQSAISRKGMLSEMTAIASEVDGTDVSEVLKTMGKIDPDVWKGYPTDTKKFLVQNQAKVVAFDRLTAGKKDTTTAPIEKKEIEKPLNKDVVSGVNADLLKNTKFNAEYEKQKGIYFAELQNGVLTDNDIVDIVKVKVGASK